MAAVSAAELPLAVLLRSYSIIHIQFIKFTQPTLNANIHENYEKCTVAVVKIEKDDLLVL